MSTIVFKFQAAPSDDTAQTSADSELADWQREYYSVRVILADYVQPDSILSLDEAIGKVARFWNDTRAGYAVAVIMGPVDVAQQIPYDHPSHKKLAEFVLAFQASGKWIPEHASKQERRFEQRNMLDSLCSYLRDRDWRPEEEVTDETTEYANICAFVANLTFLESMWSQEQFFYYLAKVALADMTELEPTIPVEVRDARIIAAAQYIIFQAQTIFDEVIESRKRQAESETSKGCFSRLVRRERKVQLKEQRRPEEQFYWEEWQAWKRGFRSAAADETLGKISRDFAQRAVDLMAVQEKIQGDRSAGS